MIYITLGDGIYNLHVPGKHHNTHDFSQTSKHLFKNQQSSQIQEKRTSLSWAIFLGSFRVITSDELSFLSSVQELIYEFKSILYLDVCTQQNT